MSDSNPGAKPPRPVPAFHNPEFMESGDARPIRIMSEYVEPRTRFERLNVNNTIVFFGSARTRSLEDAQARVRVAKSKLDSGEAGAKFQEEHETAKRMEHMAQYYEDAVELARRLTEWSVATREPSERFFICSGGGPGIMEAANRGAHEAGGRSVGLNIGLPFEQAPNEYQSPELAFEFHYFFMRKFWFVYLAKPPGKITSAFGTMDEMFELLTIIQTEKTSKYMPIILYGSPYWKEVVNFEAMVRWGTIDSDDLSLFRFCDSVDDAFSYLQAELLRLYPPSPQKGSS